MNKNIKKPLLLWSLLVMGLGLSVAFAQIHVKSDLSNAIQNIQKIYFSPQGIKDADPNKNILVEMQDGVLRILHGKVIVEAEDGSHTISPEAKNPLLIQGRHGSISWKNSILVWGQKNRFFENSESDTIFWGIKNFAYEWSQNWVIFVGEENKIQTWSNSVIAAGAENLVEGKNSFIAGGRITEIKGDDSFAAGRNIKQADTPKNSVFLWSDSKLRTLTETDLKPAQNDTFLIRAANGVAIGKNTPVVKGLDVQGLVQIGDQEVVCSAKTKGVIRYIGDEKGCFCTCNGVARLAMSQSKNCMKTCGNAKGTDLVKPAPSLELTPSSIYAPANGTTETVTVTSNQTWNASSNQAWVSVSPASGTNDGSFTVSVESNTSQQPRTASITVTGGGLSKTIAVIQAKAEKKNNSRNILCPNEWKPRGREGVVIGAWFYEQKTANGGTSRSPEKGKWTYTDSSTPNACEWTCSNGYKRSNNTCIALPQCNTRSQNYYFYRNENGVWDRTKQLWETRIFNTNDLKFEWEHPTKPNYVATSDLYYEEYKGSRKTFCKVGVPVAIDGEKFLKKVWWFDEKVHGRQFTYKCESWNELSDLCTVRTNIPNAEIRSIDRPRGRKHGFAVFCREGYKEKWNSCVKDNAPACGIKINTCVHGTVEKITKDEYNANAHVGIKPSKVLQLWSDLTATNRADYIGWNHSFINERFRTMDWPTTCDWRNAFLQEERNRYWKCNIKGKTPAFCSASTNYPQVKLCDKSRIESDLTKKNAVIKNGCYIVFKEEKDKQPDWEFLGPYTPEFPKQPAVAWSLEEGVPKGCTYWCKVGEVYDRNQGKCIKADWKMPIFDRPINSWYYGTDGSCCFSTPGKNANNPRDALGCSFCNDSAGRNPLRGDRSDPYFNDDKPWQSLRPGY